MACAFLLGYLLAAHDSRQFAARIQALQLERDALTEQLAAQRADEVKLRRSHQIDVEARRAVQGQLAALEEERVRLEQKLAHMTALVEAGGRGVVEVASLDVRPVDADPKVFEYRLTLSQLIPNAPRTRGDVLLALANREEGSGRVLTPLTNLAVGKAGRHELDFADLAMFTGRFRVGETHEPLNVIVEIVPKDDTLLSSRYVIPWAAAFSDESQTGRGGPTTPN